MQVLAINCTGSDTIGLDQLTEFQGELKERTADDVEKIVKSIKKHGFSFPFFVWCHDDINHVLDGHGRLMALKRMRAEGVEIPALPCVYVTAKDEAEAKEKLLKLNSQYGTMTAESVAEFLGDIKIDLSELALPDGVLDLGKLEPTENKDDDEIPQVNEEEPAHSQRGELYRLGRHYLYCGDSTSAEDMAALMQGVKADLIVTDPPYNVAYNDYTSAEEAKANKRRTDGLKVKNDKMGGAEFREFLTKVFTNMFNVLKLGGPFYVWYVDSEAVNFNEAIKDAGGKVYQNLIWVKNYMVLGHLDYQKRHEPCLYGWKAGAGHYWNGARDRTTVYDERKNYKKMSKEQLLAEIAALRGDNGPNTVIYEDKPAKSELHPTMKPVNLFARLINNSSKQEDVILDPFAGSGTTLIAAQRTNRTAYLLELDSHYCDVIRRRWTKWADDNGVEAGPGALR